MGTDIYYVLGIEVWVCVCACAQVHTHECVNVVLSNLIIISFSHFSDGVTKHRA